MKRTKNIKRNLFKLNILSALIMTASQAHGSLVRNDIDYQYFRDFAENKGLFTVGSTNVPIYDKTGKHIGNMLQGVPMPDFSAVSRSGAYSTLVAPQHIVSVKHNVGYRTVQFGAQGNHPDAHYYNYQLVNRNEYSGSLYHDFHAPRLHKLVTDAAPVATSNVEPTIDNLKNQEIFSYYARTGSGAQYILDNGTPVKLAGAYDYLIGGAAPKPITSNNGLMRFDFSDMTDSTHGPLPTIGRAGDSGSPLFAYSPQEKRWVLVGELMGASSVSQFNNLFTTYRPEFVKERIEDAIAARLDNTGNGTHYTWQSNENDAANSTITAGKNSSTAVPLYDSSLPDTDSPKAKPSLDHGKTVYFQGKDATMTLANSIHQGAGALYFENNMTVNGQNNDITWQGAGISVAKDKQVNWQVKNPEGDRLSKLGEGTLNITAKGKNLGDISVGDGTVILAQTADEQGNKQAFHEVGIVSGRPTVVLSDAQQVDPNKIYFGYHGGRLDTHGNDLTFRYIQNVDDGARVVNHHADKTSNITITGRTLDESDIQWGVWKEEGKDLYEYQNTKRGGTDYFVLKEKGASFRYFPTNKASNDYWEYISSDRAEAVAEILKRKSVGLENMGFNGVLGEDDAQRTNGKMNVHFAPTESNRLLLLTGKTELNGDLNVQNGTVVLSGRPAPHAYDAQAKQEVIKDDDWYNRTFHAQTFTVSNQGKLAVSRNVAEVKGNFVANQQGQLALGVQSGQTPVCMRSDYTGQVVCANEFAMPSVEHSPVTHIQGNVRLNDQSQLHLGRSHWTGSLNGSTDSTAHLSNESHWTLTDNSQVGTLNMASGSRVDLGDANNTNQFNTLTINHLLSGEGSFHYRTNLMDLLGDKVVVNGAVEGTFELAVDNTGKEPTHGGRLSLLTINNPNQTANQATIRLKNNSVDAGAYRYTLINDNNDYRLYSPRKEQEIAASTEELNRRLAEITAQLEAETAAKNTAEQSLNAQRDLAERIKQEKEAAERLAQQTQAQLAAETAAKQAAEAAKTAAENAQKLAETAQKEAEAVKNAETAAKQAAEAEAMKALAAAEAAREQAEAAQRQQQTAEAALADANQRLTTEQAAKQAAETAKKQAEAAQQQAEAAKIAAETAQKLAEDAKNAEISQKEAALKRLEVAQADSVQKAKEAAQALLMAQTAEAARQQAESERERILAQLNAQVAAQKETEQQLAQAEQDKQQAEAAKQQAEQAKQQAEAAKQQAEQDKQQAEAAKQQAEQDKQQAEAAKQQAEQDKQQAEAAKQQAEQDKQQAEAEKQQAEQAKQQAEAEKQQAEQDKQRAEAEKQQAEQDKQQAEAEKQQAEQAKAQSEQLAKQWQDQLAKEQAAKQAAEQAQKRAEQARQEAELAQQKAEQAKNQAEQLNSTAQAEAEQAKQKQQQAEEALLAANQRLADEQAAKVAAETAHQKAQEALTQAQIAKASAEAAQKLMEAAKNAEASLKEAALAQAEAAQEAAMKQMTLAQQAQAEAERAQQQLTELEQRLAEAQRHQDSSNQAAADTAKAEAEQAQAQAKLAQEKAEQAQANAEKAQADAEAKLAQLRAEQKATEAALAQLQAAKQQPKQAEIISRYTNSALSEWSAQVQANQQIWQGIDQQVAYGDDNVWLNTERHKNTQSSDRYREWKQDSQLTQLGMMQKVHPNVRVGAVMSHLEADNQFDDGIQGKTRMEHLALLAQFQRDTGTFANVDLSYAHSHNRIELPRQTVAVNRHIASVGANVGHRWQWNHWGVQPNMGLRYHRFAGNQYDLDGAKVDVEAAHVLSYRAGVRVEGMFDVGAVQLRPSLSTHYVKNSGHTAHLWVNQQPFEQQFGHYFQHRLGLNTSWKQWNVEAYVGLNKGNEIHSQRHMGLKLGYRW